MHKAYYLKQKIMAKRHYIFRHLAIIKKLKKGPASFESIARYIELESDHVFTEEDPHISKRTFQRDCKEIQNIWNVQIEFNRSSKQYEIVENEEEDNHTERAMESFDLLAALQKKETVGKYLYLENRKSSGSEYFNGILHAIENELVVTFDHYSYWNNITTHRRCIAKYIKESQNRYYLIAWDLDKKNFRSFGLDRIENFVISSERIKNTPTINIKEYYKNAFGIERYDEPQPVILEFDADQKYYLESLPLHTSQKITAENEETITVKLFVHPTNDLVMEILRHGSICEVKSPESLREKVKQDIQKMVSKYNYGKP